MENRTCLCIVFIAVVSVGCASLAHGQPSEVLDSVQTQRLAAVGRVWGAVKYFHPAFSSRDVDWDAAIIAAIPDVIEATSTEAYVRAVTDMLAVLQDPRTGVVRTIGATEPHQPAGQIEWLWEADSALVVAVPRSAGGAGQEQLLSDLSQVTALLGTATHVVFDLRGTHNADDTGFLFESSGIGPSLGSGNAPQVSERRRTYLGFSPPRSGRAAYVSGTAILQHGLAPRVIEAAPAPKVAFIIDESSDVPFVAWNLQCTGRSVVLLEAEREISPQPQNLTFAIPLGEGYEATILVGELLNCRGEPLMPDQVVPPTADRRSARLAALSLLRGENAPVHRPRAEPRLAGIEERYSEMHYPSLPYRILAAYRWWNAIEYFYPHKSTLAVEWTTVLPGFIRTMAAARDSLEYIAAVYGMVVDIQDSHGSVNTAHLLAYRGEASPGVWVRYVEGRPIVMSVAAEAETQASGIRPGDVIERIDGRPVEERWEFLARVTSASSPQSQADYIARYLLAGPEASTVELVIRSAAGEPRDVHLQRKRTWNGVETTAQGERVGRGEVIEFLTDSIGYVDLTRLPPQLVDSMFTRFRETKALIVDVRGYPNNVIYEMEGYLVQNPGVVGSERRVPLVSSPNPTISSYEVTRSPLAPPNGRPYGGDVIVLIDERAISHAELTIAILRAAADALLVGSPTAGANGNVTHVVLPGGVQAFFTGADVRMGDGTPYQRIGIMPDIAVSPTIAGIRAGRDEVLEAALVYARSLSSN